MHLKNSLSITILLMLLSLAVYAQPDTATYNLTIKKEMVNKAGKKTLGMTVNGTIPGPTIRFKEGDYAVIYVKNEMDVETSVHWHGLLLPNFFDGVPYLTTPPIMPGETQKYEFPLIQSGTYWYHSHTMLQEQSGVYGAIVIDPIEETLEYDQELVMVLSDWTNQKPKNVLRNLKRGNEWYNIKKGTATPLNQVIARGAFGAQLNFWRQRMEGADIADIYYPAFLNNGQEVQEYPQFEPGDKVRLRIINGAASSQFWMTFGGEDPLLVAADGLNVVPVKHNKTFIAIAETYDFIVTIPAKGKIAFRAMAQDGSGYSVAYLGQGEIIPAPVIARPDKIKMMQQMAKMDMRMGAPAMKLNPSNEEPYELMDNWGMQMDGMNMKGMDMEKMDHSKMSHDTKPEKPGDMDMDMDMADEQDGGEMDSDMEKMDHSKMNKDTKPEKPGEMNMDMNMTNEQDGGEMDSDMEKMDHSKMNHDTKPEKPGEMNMDMNMTNEQDGGEMNSDMEKMDHSKRNKEMHEGMNMFSEYNYDYLKSPVSTAIDDDQPARDILLNLTGNMWRYIWSLNGVPLSEADMIKISKGEKVRITFNNLTMMHHPMHLHGHFFRVINVHGEYSPLKHTVNVAPMQQTVIEFDASEDSDWFLHCHVLYHMMGGMARAVSYGTERHPLLEKYPKKVLFNEGNHIYKWGMADVASHMTGLSLVASNIRNQFNLNAEVGYNQNMEAELTYERYLYDYFRVFGGVNVENEAENSLDELSATAVAGIRFFTPFMFNLDVRMDNKLRPEIRLSREIMIFPRTSIFGNYEYQADFGWVNTLTAEGTDKPIDYRGETTWSAGVEYFLNRNISLMGSYDNRFGAGGGLSIRF